LGAEPDRKLGLAGRADIDRVSGSLFKLATVAGEDVMVRSEILATSRRCVTVALCLAGIGGAAVLIGGSLTIPSPARATPVFAGQTGLPCTRCHTAGGKALTDFGKEFQANGTKLKKQ
jgi:hypothetical protein